MPGEGFEPSRVASLLRRGCFPLPDIVLPPIRKTQGTIPSPPTPCPVRVLSIKNAGRGIRTLTGASSQRILSPLRLPFRHPGFFKLLFLLIIVYYISSLSIIQIILKQLFFELNLKQKR